MFDLVQWLSAARNDLERHSEENRKLALNLPLSFGDLLRDNRDGSGIEMIRNKEPEMTSN
jgi:hypothetical protein